MLKHVTKFLVVVALMACGAYLGASTSAFAQFQPGTCQMGGTCSPGTVISQSSPYTINVSGNDELCLNSAILYPCTASGLDFGSVSFEFRGGYLGEGALGGLHLGLDQDHRIYNDETDTNTLVLDADSMVDFRLSGVDNYVLNGARFAPATAGNRVLGGTTNEWGGLYLGDDDSVFFGFDQDVTVDFDSASGALVINNTNDVEQFYPTYREIYVIEAATPTEPVACAAGTHGATAIVDDTDDTSWAQECICLNLDGTGYDWRARHDPTTTECPFF